MDPLSSLPDRVETPPGEIDARETTPPPRALRVLIVEDSETDAGLLLRQMERDGYSPASLRVASAADLETALAGQPWDLVLSDYAMPGFGGLEALRIVKASGLDLPFILISGAIGEDLAVAAMKLGAHDYLLKENLTRLGVTVARELEEARERRGRRQAEAEARSAEEELRRLLLVAKASRHTLLSMVEDQKRAEQALRLQTTALEAAANAIIITNSDGVIEWCNPAFAALTGHGIEESLGRNLHDLVRSDQHDPAVYKQMWDTILAGQVWRGELVNHRKDGALYTEEQTITPVLGGDGQVTHFIAVKQDVTERKRAEEERQTLDAQLTQAQKMESVGRLAGGVAHDFNNALAVILGRAEYALKRVAPEDRLHRDLEEIREAALRSANLTRQLLAFARKQTIAPRVLDLSDAVAGILKMLRRLIGEDIQLAWMPGAALWPVKMDPAQIDQLLANLLVNARDAIGGVGKVTIETRNVVIDELHCARETGCVPGEYVLLVVSDSGCGMNKHVRDHMFEPFFTTKPVGQGTGLGLSTVYGIVTQNSGFVTVHSEPGQGATFKVYLPRVREEVPDPEATRAMQEPRGHGETILLVEDEPAMLEIGAETLVDLGYTVLSAGTPDQALSVAKAHPGEIHLLVTDVIMPGMNGRDLAERLSEIRPEIRRLFVSGYTADIIARHGFLNEGVRFLEKPFSRLTLAVKVREVLDSE